MTVEYHTRYRLQKKQPLLDINNMTMLNNIVECYINISMDIFCIHCNAKHFAAEKIINKTNLFHDCCNYGTIYLQLLFKIALISASLFDGNHVKSNDFFNHIRSYITYIYNNSFSFASFNANLINFRERRPSPYCFKIQGQIYYQINIILHAAQNKSPTYGQLFIVDSNEATDYRLNQNSYLDFHIVTNLEKLIRECNIFAQSY